MSFLLLTFLWTSTIAWMQEVEQRRSSCRKKSEPAAGVTNPNLAFLVKRICCSEFIFRLLASNFSLRCQRKVTKRKATQIVRVSCAFQEITVVPVRHPCRIVTKTHVLCVFRKFPSNARRTHMGFAVRLMNFEYLLFGIGSAPL